MIQSDFDNIKYDIIEISTINFLVSEKNIIDLNKAKPEQNFKKSVLIFAHFKNLKKSQRITTLLSAKIFRRLRC